MNLREISGFSARRMELLLKEHGAYLSSRQEPKFFIDLYKLDAFYIEIYYQHRKPEYNFIKVDSKGKNLILY